MKSWRERIAEAHERGAFTGEDKARAKDWCSCGVGEQLRVAGLYTDEETTGQFVRDRVLIDLGSHMLEGPDDGFCHAVVTDDIDRAGHVLDLIEDRVRLLKTEAR